MKKITNVEVRAKAFEEAANLIPTTWLDPLLSGPGAIQGLGECRAVEEFCRLLRSRITSTACFIRASRRKTRKEK